MTMIPLFYLFEPISIKGSDYLIVALSKDGSPYGVPKSRFSGNEEYDLDRSVPLMPLFTRKAESNGEVPDYGDLMNSVTAAVIRGGQIYGKDFFQF